MLPLLTVSEGQLTPFPQQKECLSCPDFDTCARALGDFSFYVYFFPPLKHSAPSIIQEQHPDHSFAKLQKPEDYIVCHCMVLHLHYATLTAAS